MNACKVCRSYAINPHLYGRGNDALDLCDVHYFIAQREALQSECEKLRNLLRHAQPIIKAHAGASHMLEGFRPRRNQWDELVEAIDTAMKKENNP